MKARKVKIRKAELHLTRFIANYVGLWGIENDLENDILGFLHGLGGS